MTNFALFITFKIQKNLDAITFYKKITLLRDSFTEETKQKSPLNKTLFDELLIIPNQNFVQKENEIMSFLENYSFYTDGFNPFSLDKDTSHLEYLYPYLEELSLQVFGSMDQDVLCFNQKTGVITLNEFGTFSEFFVVATNANNFLEMLFLLTEFSVNFINGKAESKEALCSTLVEASGCQESRLFCEFILE
jgi:hypothetical protein